jgi:hypothetical protein
MGLVPQPMQFVNDTATCSLTETVDGFVVEFVPSVNAPNTAEAPFGENFITHVDWEANEIV